MPPPESLAARLAAENHGALDACVGNADGSVLLVRHRFDAAEGRMGQTDGLRIGLLVGGGGPLYQHTALGCIARPWLPGEINIALPGDAGEFRSPALDLLGMVVDTQHLHRDGRRIPLHDLHAAASALQRDPVISAVLWALWQCAEAHAGAAAFFEQGIDIVLRRLAAMSNAPVAAVPRTRTLSAAYLARVQALIEAHLDEDLSVARMAHETGQDSSSFSRSFQQATGTTPFAYLTLQRMERAKRLLLAGRAVTHVALAVGYANPGKFAAAFRRVTGRTPTQWRQVHGGATRT